MPVQDGMGAGDLGRKMGDSDHYWRLIPCWVMTLALSQQLPHLTESHSQYFAEGCLTSKPSLKPAIEGIPPRLERFSLEIPGQEEVKQALVGV